MTGKIVYSTSGRSGAFLKWSWDRRLEMGLSQRHGLAQAIYAALVAHSEATMFEVLKCEYRRVASVVHHATGDDASSAIRSAGEMLQLMLEDRLIKLQSMAFDQLFKELSQLLYPSFQQGPARHASDLEAIRNLRNLFVHGREASLPLATETGVRIDTDGSKMKQALDRLVSAGVLSKADTIVSGTGMGGDESRLYYRLFDDDAVLHFVKIGRAFQTQLLEIVPHSADLAYANEFPDLAVG